MSENEKFVNRKAGKAPEKSNFAQACTLLGQFLKEKRNLGVVIGNAEIAKEKLPETPSFRPPIGMKNFLTNMGNQTQDGPSAVQNGTVSASTMVKSSDFFQQFKGFGTPLPPGPNVEDANKPDIKKSTSTAVVKPETAQMTIFYGGQVLVFNDLSADKANEVMALARKGSSNISGSVSTSTPAVVEKIDLTKPAAPERNVAFINKSDNSNNNININDSVPKNIDLNDNNDDNNKRESLHKRPADQTANGSDLPIARRNSLHRFLEKRKDRVAAKAPYQVVNHRPVAAPPKPDEGNQSSAQQEGGECSDQHLELKL